MKFLQHIPDFCSGVDPISFEFQTLQELLKHPWVKLWSLDADFVRYSINGTHLICEKDRGARRWVIGFISGGDAKALDLPKWEPKKI